MQLLTFTMKEVTFGIPVSNVESIETKMNVVGIPNSPPNIRGIINLHGDIVPIYNLASKFGYEEQKIENVVVAGVNGMKIGLEVGRVKEILEVDDVHIIPMPEIMNATQNCFNDVASNNKELIVLLDTEQLFPAEEQQGLKKIIEDNL